MNSPNSLYIPHASSIRDLFNIARANRLAKPTFHFISHKLQIPLKLVWNGENQAWFNETSPWVPLGFISWNTNLWHHKNTHTDERKADYHETLCLMAEDPINFAIDFIAKTTNHCMFCGIGLTHPNSVAAGYGPICADKYGLPWENVAEREKAKTRKIEMSNAINDLFGDLVSTSGK